MEEENDRSGRLMRTGRGAACCLVMALAVTEDQSIAAPVLSGHHAPHTLVGGGPIAVAGEPALGFSVQAIDTEPGKETLIALRLPSSAELRGMGADEGTFLLIRNVPEGMTISAGMSAGRIWVVPLRDAASLRLLCRSGINAPFQLSFHLIGPNKRVLAETTATVNLTSRRPVVAIAPASPKPGAPQPPASPAPRLPAETLPAEAEAVLLARGKELIQEGGIAAARLILEELAANGSAAGALILARSYDPAFLVVSGTAPDPNLAEARKWYERAAELGNSDARRRLVEIASGR